jgi:hypothetical protein
MSNIRTFAGRPRSAVGTESVRLKFAGVGGTGAVQSGPDGARPPAVLKIRLSRCTCSRRSGHTNRRSGCPDIAVVAHVAGNAATAVTGHPPTPRRIYALASQRADRHCVGRGRRQTDDSGRGKRRRQHGDAITRLRVLFITFSFVAGFRLVPASCAGYGTNNAARRSATGSVGVNRLIRAVFGNPTPRHRHVGRPIAGG